MSEAAVKTGRLSGELLSRLIAIVSDRMGLYFPPHRHKDFVAGIGAAAGEFGLDDATSCAEWLVSTEWSRSQIETLAGCLTIGETYFFRNEGDVALLRDVIIPELVGARRKRDKTLRFWSAGSCTGEEPYTIAMLLHDGIPDIEEWNITILGTDINPRFLRKAAEGVYSAWSFRETPDEIRQRYFHRTGDGQYAICRPIREMVRFEHLNLAAHSYPSLKNSTDAMDVILCRNVLIYFTPMQSDQVLGALGRSLVEGGWLIASPSDGVRLSDGCLKRIHSKKALYFRKETGRSRSGAIEATDGVSSRVADSLSEMRTPRARQPRPAPDKVKQGSTTPNAKSEIAKTGRNRLNRAHQLFEQGDFTEATDLLAELCADSLPSGEALKLMARVHANGGQLSEAMVWCEKAVARSKMDPDVHHLRAAILQELGRADEAADALRRVLYLDSDQILAHFALGSLCKQGDRIDEARRHFANALDLLRGRPQDELIEQSDGITVGRMITIIEAMTR